MTAQNGDSFDHYGGSITNMSQGGWTFGGGASLSLTQPRTGLYSLNIGGNSARYAVPNPQDTMVFGHAFWKLDLTSGTFWPFIIYDITAGVRLSVVMLTSGAVGCYLGATSGAFAGTSTGPVVTSAAYNYIELKTKIHATAGYIIVRVNNQVVMSVTNIDTRGAYHTDSNINAVEINSQASTQNYVDDFYACDTLGSQNNDFLGDIRGWTVYATGDTAQTDLSRSTGSSNFALVGKLTPNDTTYLFDSVAGHKTDCSVLALPTTVGTINFVCLKTRMLKSDSGARTARGALKSSTSLANGATYSPGTTAAYFTDCMETDPATTVPWTRTGVNAMLMRCEIVS